MLIDPPVNDMEFTSFLEKKGIMVRHVGNFGAPGKVRISFGVREANKALLAAIEVLMKSQTTTA